MKIIRICQFLILLVLSSTACAQLKDAGFEVMLNSLLDNSVPQLQSNDLSTILSDTSIIILDTREPNEFEVSHIQGAINVGYDRFKKSSIKEIPKDKPIIVYCSVGYRSEKIGEKLQAMGFENVKNLRGGIFDWKNTGHEVVNSENQKTEKVHAYDKTWGIWLKEGEKVYE